MTPGRKRRVPRGSSRISWRDNVVESLLAGTWRKKMRTARVKPPMGRLIKQKESAIKPYIPCELGICILDVETPPPSHPISKGSSQQRSNNGSNAKGRSHESDIHGTFLQRNYLGDDDSRT